MDAHLISQLRAPHPVGINLALLRTRMYRFSGDLRHYVLAEALEERFIDGQPPEQATLDYIAACLDRIRSVGHPVPFDSKVAENEGIDVDGELQDRSAFAPQRTARPSLPRQIVCILGAPRSGTSHLFNLLAYQRHFAYFTTVTCWSWPTRNLALPQHRSFEHLPPEVLAVDNKTTRIVPGLVMPYEGEDVFARAIPTYRHVAGHTYDINLATTADASLLFRAVEAHKLYFERQRFLTKSPFNAFRVSQLERLFGTSVRYIHITRDRDEVAESMARNGFTFRRAGRRLDGGQAHDLFTSSIRSASPEPRTFVVTHRELLSGPDDVIDGIISWLAVHD